jgi:hypothetical protein
MSISWMLVICITMESHCSILSIDICIDLRIVPGHDSLVESGPVRAVRALAEKCCGVLVGEWWSVILLRAKYDLF